MQIDYVNNKFLMEFDHEILSIYDKNSSNQPDESSLVKPGVIKKVTNLIKTIKKVLFKSILEDDNFMKNSEFLNIDIFEKQYKKDDSTTNDATKKINFTFKDLLKPSFIDKNHHNIKFCSTRNDEIKKFYQVKATIIENNNTSSIML